VEKLDTGKVGLDVGVEVAVSMVALMTTLAEVILAVAVPKGYTRATTLKEYVPIVMLVDVRVVVSIPF